MKSLLTLNPMFVSISILVLSIFITISVFKTTNSSWIAFVTILTFSSGMMTLFMYTTSMTANEKTKTKKSMIWLTLLLIVAALPPQKTNFKESMKMFSNTMILLILGTILIITMISISSHGHHPNQTISSSF